MIAVLNLFDVVAGREAMYAEYLRRVRPLLERHGARVLFYGATRARLLGSCGQGYCGIIAYETHEDLCRFSRDPEFLEVRRLRDGATANYVMLVLEGLPMEEAAAHLVGAGTRDACGERSVTTPAGTDGRPGHANGAGVEDAG